MTTLAEFHRTVERTLAGKKLGSVVFVRYLLTSQDKADGAVNRLAQLLAVVRTWLDQPLERVYAVGSPKAGQVSVTVECRGGATACVTWARSPVRGLGVDLMVLGNHGAIYHDFGTAMLWDEAVRPLTDAPNQDLVTLIDRTLRSQRPESAGKGGKP